MLKNLIISYHFGYYEIFRLIDEIRNEYVEVLIYYIPKIDLKTLSKSFTLKLSSNIN